MSLRELSIFIDESGDFGDYQEHCPFYIISLVFHEQNNSIETQVDKLNQFLIENNLKNHTIHTAPLIRQEQGYKYMDIALRSKIFKQLFNFVRGVDISYKTIVVDKKMFSEQVDIIKIKMFFGSVSKLRKNYFKFFERIEFTQKTKQPL